MLGAKLANIGKTLFYKLDSVVIHILKIVRGIVEAVVPIVAQPMNVLFDRIDIFNVLLGGVGIVHAEVADAAVFLRCAEIDVDRLGVTDVKISVRLGRETGVNLHTSVASALGYVLVDKVVDKILCVFVHSVFHSSNRIDVEMCCLTIIDIIYLIHTYYNIFVIA